MSRISRLKISNFTRILYAEVDASGKRVLKIGGKNGHGKTSIINAVKSVYNGKRAFPPRPVRDGAEKAVIQAVEDNGDTVRRSITVTGGGEVSYRSANGTAVAGPTQTTLDSRCSPLCFDPMGFFLMASDKQGETVRRMLGLDFSDIVAQRDKVYAARTELNRLEKSELSAAQALTFTPNLPETPLSMSDLMAELQAERKRVGESGQQRNEIDAAKRELAELERTKAACADHIARLEKELAQARNKLAEVTGEIAAVSPLIEDMEKQVAGIAPSRENEIAQKMTGIQETNRLIENNLSIAKHRDAADAYRVKADECTAALEKLEVERTRRIAVAKFPVPHLSFDPDGGLLYNDLPLDSASTAERMTVSCGIGFASLPKIENAMRIMLVDNAELLDDSTRALLVKTAGEYDCDLWLVYVMHDGQNPDEFDVVIEDGEDTKSKAAKKTVAANAEAK